MGILNYELYTLFADTTEDEALIDSKEITQQAVNELKGIHGAGSTAILWG